MTGVCSGAKGKYRTGQKSGRNLSNFDEVKVAQELQEHIKQKLINEQKKEFGVNLSNFCEVKAGLKFNKQLVPAALD